MTVSEVLQKSGKPKTQDDIKLDEKLIDEIFNISAIIEQLEQLKTERKQGNNNG